MSTRNPARLIVALSVAAVLAVFLLYTAVAGNSTPTFTPSQLQGHAGKLSVVGAVIGPTTVPTSAILPGFWCASALGMTSGVDAPARAV